jgi:hypothetical protein
VSRALYIDGAVKTGVALDGPALLVRTAGSADRRYPLARIGRITAWGDIAWSHQAICCCLAAGIPLLFHTGGREIAGYAVPARPKKERWTSRLERFAERPDARQRYADWLRSEERRAMRAAGCFRRGVQIVGPGPALQSAVAGLLTEVLEANGFRVEMLAACAPWFRPVLDWSRVLCWRVPERPSAMRHAAAVVNTRQPQIRREIDNLIRRLAHWLGEQEWNSISLDS